MLCMKYAKMIQLLLTLFRTLFSSLTGEISLLGLRINLSPVGKLCVSMKVMILHQIQRMKKGYVQRKTGPTGLSWGEKGTLRSPVTHLVAVVTDVVRCCLSFSAAPKGRLLVADSRGGTRGAHPN
jgi:hypothetical protein